MARVVEAASETERVIKRKADSSAVARINEHRRRPGNGGVDDCRLRKPSPRPFSSQGRAPQLDWKAFFFFHLFFFFFLFF